MSLFYSTTAIFFYLFMITSHQIYNYGQSHRNERSSILSRSFLFTISLFISSWLTYCVYLLLFGIQTKWYYPLGLLIISFIITLITNLILTNVFKFDYLKFANDFSGYILIASMLTNPIFVFLMFYFLYK